MKPRQSDPIAIKVLEQLRRCFSTPFEIWIRDTSGQWVLDIVQDFSTTPSRQQDIASILKESRDLAEVQIMDCQDAGKRLIIVPFAETPQTMVAVGEFCMNEATLVKQLTSRVFLNAELNRRINQQTECIDEFSRQVSDNFEEMIWLRRFAAQAVVSEQLDLISIVRPSLESLRRIIKCDSLIVMTDPLSTQATNEYLVVGHPIENSIISDIVDKNRDCSDIQPLVLNGLTSEETIDPIDSILIVSISGCAKNFGWLIAVNKHPDHSEHSSATRPTGSKGGEFGTQEASLLEAAAAIMAVHASNTDLFQQKDTLLIGTIRAMMHVIEAKDPYTRGHSDRVAKIARRIARQLRLSNRECDQIYISGLVHDIGKIGVPDHILNKQGRLTEEEFNEIKKHPRRGLKILRALEQIDNVLPGVLYHHEAVDGSGYPECLRGDQIPLVARILAVSDAYDAMTSDRPYRKGMDLKRAEEVLLNGAGQQWDLQVVKAFFSALDDIHEICDSADKFVPGTPDSPSQDASHSLESPTNFGDVLRNAVISSSRN